MLYILLKLLTLLPLNALRRIADVLAFLLYYSNSSFKRISQANIGLVYPQKNAAEQKNLLKKNVKSQCYTYVESMKSWAHPPAYTLSLINQIEGEAVFKAALDSKKGVIVVLTHFGCWEFLNVWINQFTNPTIMYKPNKNAGVNRFILESREKFKATLVPTNESGVKAIFKHLKQGGLTVILPDHLPKPSGGIQAKFFDQDVLCTTLVSKLAQKTQCKVLGLSCIRTDNGFKIICQDMHDDILSPDLERSVNQLNADMQQMINQAPEQYIWSYKRFRRMASHPNLYKAN